MASQSGGDTIASQEDLERFATLEPAERQLTEALKGVVAETALTGRNRYPFSLVKPVVELLLEQVMEEACMFVFRTLNGCAQTHLCMCVPFTQGMHAHLCM